MTLNNALYGIDTRDKNGRVIFQSTNADAVLSVVVNEQHSSELLISSAQKVKLLDIRYPNQHIACKSIAQTHEQMLFTESKDTDSSSKLRMAHFYKY